MAFNKEIFKEIAFDYLKDNLQINVESEDYGGGQIKLKISLDVEGKEITSDDVFIYTNKED